MKNFKLNWKAAKAALFLGLLWMATQARASTLNVTDVFASSDSEMIVPVTLDADGIENAVSFSLQFDPAAIAFDGFVANEIFSGGFVIVNDARKAEGLIAILAARPVGTTIASGSAEIGKLSFSSRGPSGRVEIRFGDEPLPRQTSSADAVAIASGYRSGTVTFDRRSVNALDASSVNGSEFRQLIQAVGSGIENAWSFTLQFDPTHAQFVGFELAKGALGGTLIPNTVEAADGKIGVLLALPSGQSVPLGTNDLLYVRYKALAADRVSDVTFVASPVGLQTVDPTGRILAGVYNKGRLDSGARALRVPISTPGEIGSSVIAPVSLVASGVENALSFSFTFDPAELVFQSASVPDSISGAALQVNANGAAAGSVGIFVALSAGAKFSAGENTVALLRFFARGTPAITPIHFGDTPVARELADSLGATLTFGTRDGSITLARPSSPAIVFQPVDTSALPGANATLTVGADGQAPLQYQWRKNDVDLLGQTNSTLQIATAGESAEGFYSVEVRNALGSVVSQRAEFQLFRAPLITQPPSNVRAIAGQDVTLAVTATGLRPLNYQWRKNGADIPGATGQSLSLSHVSSGSIGDYTVLVSNLAGSAPAGLAHVTVLELPGIASAPVGGTQPVHGSITLTVGATGTPPLRYQWKLNGQNLIGKTDSSLTVPDIHLTDAGLYTVTIANDLESITTTPVELRVSVPPAPAEDAFARATPITDSFQVSGSSEFATAEGGEPAHANVPATHSVWFKWRSPIAGRVTLDTVGSAFDTVLEVYTGSDFTSLHSIAADDDGGTNLWSSLKFNAQANVDYYFALDGFPSGIGRDSGNYVLTGDFVAGTNVFPTIEVQPASQTAPTNVNLTLSVVATGFDLTYQWSHNGRAIPGATSSTLPINNFNPAQVGSYAVTVANPAGLSVRSQYALVEIGQPGVHSVDKPQRLPATPAPAPAKKTAQLAQAAATGAGLLQVSFGSIANHTFDLFGEGEVFGGGSCPHLGNMTRYLSIIASSSGILVVDAKAAVNFNMSFRDPEVPTVILREDCNALSHRLEIPILAGQILLVATDSNTDGPVDLAVALGSAPVLLGRDAERVDVPAGESTELDASAFASLIPKASLQWMLNGQPIAGATGTNFTATAAGAYSVLVSNAIGQITQPIGTIFPLAPLKFGAPSVAPQATEIQFHFSGNNGQSYQITWTTNFLKWTIEKDGWINGADVDERVPILRTNPHRIFRLEEKPLADSVSAHGPLRDGTVDVAISGGRLGQRFVLQRQDGLGPWVPLLTNTVQGATFHYFDKIPGGAAARYQAASASRN